MTSQLEFEPSWFLRNPHMQTFVGRTLRPTNGISYIRERFETPDGDFVDVDHPYFSTDTQPSVDPQTPILVALHGLEGNSRRTYMIQLYRQALAAGWRCVGVNFRGCSGEDNRLPQQYHAGFTNDLSFVLTQMQARFPQAKFALAGFSLGGNVVLNFTGTDALPAAVIAVAAISPPVDLVEDIAYFSRPGNKFYDNYFLRSIKQKLREKLVKHPENSILQAGLQAQTLFEFDNVCTGPLNGFADANDYYSKARALNNVLQIACPTLIIRSEDDPFFAPHLPDAVYQNKSITVLHPQYGGHVGFVGKRNLGEARFWGETQAIKFISNNLALT